VTPIAIDRAEASAGSNDHLGRRLRQTPIPDLSEDHGVTHLCEVT